MENLIITKDVLDIYDKYEGDFGLLDERWASKKDREKVTMEQSSLFCEYLSLLPKLVSFIDEDVIRIVKDRMIVFQAMNIKEPIFVFVEEGYLDVHETLQETYRECELSAIQSKGYQMFDGKGNLLKAIVTKESKDRSILGLVEWTKQGKYILKKDPEPACHFRDRIDLIHTIHDNLLFLNIEEVYKYFCLKPKP